MGIAKLFQLDFNFIMNRRFFIKTGLAGISSVVLSSALNASDMQTSQKKPAMGKGEDFSVVSDETKNGVRYVTAVPSALVCSKKIEIQIDVKSMTIKSVVYFRGCDGNAKGMGALLKGMSVDEAVKRLEGINCAGRGTSCPDQLAKVLRSLKW